MTAKKKAKNLRMNVALLRKVQKHITEEPRRYEQNATLECGLEPGTWVCSDFGGYAKEVPSCGTIACIGGWVLLLGMKRPPRKFDHEKAEKLLRINLDQSQRLFSYVVGSVGSVLQHSWPNKFHDAYLKAKTPKQKVKVACARIDHFIATKGAE